MRDKTHGPWVFAVALGLLAATVGVMPKTFEQLAAGLSPDEAVEAFLDGCNKPDRVNLSSHRLAHTIPSLRRALPDPITAEIAEALVAAANRRLTLERVISWLDHLPMMWSEYDAHLAGDVKRRDLADRQRAYDRVIKDLENRTVWTRVRALADRVGHPGRARRAKDRYSAEARPCPKCGAEPRALRWIAYSTPESMWRNLCGRAGWMTLCNRCRLQIDFFVELLN